uniref:Uncharacterized protein n=1 Tax=Mus spicilegus TaxID=10103 RepID=A0A8C6G849_MUSSI
MKEYASEPCPCRIVDDCVGAFTMGVIGGGVFQAIKGLPVRALTTLLKVLSSNLSNHMVAHNHL